MREIYREETIPDQEMAETEKVSRLASNVFRLNTGEFIVVRQIERQGGKLIGLDAGALLRLICKKTGVTTGQAYEEAKKYEEIEHYDPKLPELKYLELGIRSGIFRWISDEEREMMRGAQEGVKIIKI